MNMARCRWMMVVGLLLVALMPVRSAAADAAPMEGAGGNLKPVESSQVVMVSERVDIWPHPDVRGFWGYARVRAVFNFRNDGPAADVLMGFPLAGREYGWIFAQDFSVMIDGDLVTTEFVEQHLRLGKLNIVGWQVFSVPSLRLPG